MTTGITQSTASASLARRTTPRTDPIRTGPIATTTTAITATPVTRRAAREADRQAVKASRKSSGIKKGVVSATVMTLTAGLFGTLALPAFAQTPTDSATGSSAATAAISAGRTSGSQSMTVASTVADSSVSRDSYTTTVPVVHKPAAAPVTTPLSSTATAAAEAKRASLAKSYAYSGPTASDYLAQAAPPAFSLAAVFSSAQKYIGTPYVFGGATPAGFDCSGFVMYVYAQYGISLPHSVSGESAAGTTIPQSEAQPGDIVVLNDGSHDGFYAGNGMILDAPKPGGAVSIRPLWTSDVHYVRFGIK